MKNWMYRLLGVCVVTVLTSADLWAQCAMCRGSVESTMGNGRNDVGVGLNTGIVYLFVVPYLTVMAIGYFWYKSSKKEQEKRRFILAGLRRAEGGYLD